MYNVQHIHKIIVQARLERLWFNKEISIVIQKKTEMKSKKEASLIASFFKKSTLYARKMYSKLFNFLFDTSGQLT